MTGPNWVDGDQVQKMIDDALSREREAHASELATRDAQIEALQNQNRALVVTAVPEHAGGPGNEIAETWSKFQQEQAIAEARG